ncbi:UDP-2,3-diacylglucosamine diphosphatase [Motilimonas sp. 1_MG-2023]|uniref:UDP-2,3-diacylglucosamine diphosphatase n=1 Tax=Motilimonas sp. 1_MG-2023 TaxID=3062672 RepID=UPI0026E3E156|nr:UDP-2,3-diacylglucosamine diphosphatase [Motilimonas sp. 1_MG-2023]MDO6527982.1 UDP-2,3-diacylglucosamine diphosphatase [Motilimonas sp. 1_MG-2023]
MAKVIHYYRTVWLSDVHLGFKDCKAEYLIQFLQSMRCDKLILAGDIVDFWALKRQVYWPESHMKVVQLLLDIARQGTQVIYVPGNHDAAIRQLGQPELNLAQIHHQYQHTTSLGLKVLVIHGDEFDAMVCYSKITSFIGDLSYDLLLFLNRHVYHLRKRLGFNYWSLAGYIKERIPKANIAISRFRHAAMAYGRRKGVNMVVCGHIHHPEMVTEGDMIYTNLGDWVENCSALVEELDGNLHLVRSTEQTEFLQHLDEAHLSSVA